MKKKIFSILLALCLALSLLPGTALAAFRINAEVTVNVNGTASGNYTVYLDKDESKTENWKYTLTYSGGNYYLNLDTGDEGPFYVFVYSGTSLAYRSSAAVIYYINDDNCNNSATVNFYNLGGDAPQLAPTATWTDEISKNGAVSGTDYVIDGNSVTINTNRGLAWMASNSTYWASAYTVSLAADIDMSTRIWTPFGSNSTPFSAVFDGQGHTVSGIYINGSGTFQGLFGYLFGSVNNLGVIDSYIACSDNYGGGIAGYINGGSVSNCYNTGSVKNSGGGSSNYVGGIAGYIKDGSVSNCYNTGSVNGGKINIDVGGIAGKINGGSVSNCYNTGSVNGIGSIGGIVGYNSGSVSSCYALQGCGVAAICVGTAASDSAWFADNDGTL